MSFLNNPVQVLVLFVLLTFMTALASATASAAETATPSGADKKTIGITLVSDLDKKVPKANAAIFFAYYDPMMKTWQKSSQQTDTSGKCSFLLPAGEGGESYAFLYATSQDALDNGIKGVTDGKLLMWRIPPGDQQEIEILIGGNRASNTKGSLQLWSIK
jgi:hypothetical protein